MEAHQAKLSFFKASTCQQLLERLVAHYLLLSDEELQEWQDNPEEFGELFVCVWDLQVMFNGCCCCCLSVKEEPGDTYTCSLRVS